MICDFGFLIFDLTFIFKKNNENVVEKQASNFYHQETLKKKILITYDKKNIVTNITLITNTSKLFRIILNIKKILIKIIFSISLTNLKKQTNLSCL